MFDKYTLGIEEEFQIVDPETRLLVSHVSEILEEGKMLLGEQVKPEMMQAQVEVGTGICKNIEEARADITRLRAIVSHLARTTPSSSRSSRWSRARSSSSASTSTSASKTASDRFTS